MMRDSKGTARFKIRIQSAETGMYLSQTGVWTRTEGVRSDEMLSMNPVEGLRLCLRLGLRNVRFIATCAARDEAVALYPFGGDPSVKACQRQLRKKLAEDRRERAQRNALKVKIRTLEQVQTQRAP